MCPMPSGRGYRKSSTPRPWNPSRVQASLQMGSLRRIQTRKCSHAPVLVSGSPVIEQWHAITSPRDGTLGIDSWLAANGLNQLYFSSSLDSQMRGSFSSLYQSFTHVVFGLRQFLSFFFLTMAENVFLLIYYTFKTSTRRGKNVLWI